MSYNIQETGQKILQVQIIDGFSKVSSADVESWRQYFSDNNIDYQYLYYSMDDMSEIRDSWMQQHGVTQLPVITIMSCNHTIRDNIKLDENNEPVFEMNDQGLIVPAIEKVISWVYVYDFFYSLDQLNGVNFLSLFNSNYITGQDGIDQRFESYQESVRGSL